MARDFARSFYKSKQWESTRDAYARSVHGLCEPCARSGKVSIGVIVHHKEHLTPENIEDPAVALSFDNLELVCRKCHAACHPEIYGSKKQGGAARVAFDEDGNVVRL